ncbi:trimeric LpxA-like protein, partial [Piedraia hortae CBS 480.64]
CQIHPSAVVADKAQLIGSYPIEIGENAVIHPWARICATKGRVVIGRSCIVYEMTVIGHSDMDAPVQDQDVVLGEGVTVESRAVVQAKSIGNRTTIEVGAVIGHGAVVGQWCKISPLERIRRGEMVEDYKVVYGNGQWRINDSVKNNEGVRQAKHEAQSKSVKLMKKMVSNGAAKW